MRWTSVVSLTFISLSLFSTIAQSSDLDIFLSCLQSQTVDQCGLADFNGDGVVTTKDYILFRNVTAGDFNNDGMTDLRDDSGNQDRSFLISCVLQNTLPDCDLSDLNNDTYIDDKDLAVFNNFVVFDLNGDKIVDFKRNTGPEFQNADTFSADDDSIVRFYIWAKDSADGPVSYTAVFIPEGVVLTPVILGDFNDDGVVDDKDIKLIQENYCYDQQFDLNNDGAVDDLDIDLLQQLVGTVTQGLVFEWTPGANGSGVYEIIITASDSNGLMSEARISLTIFDTDAPVDYYLYDDVLIVVNDKSFVSQQIGDYFAQARGIPTKRMAVISTPETETISRTTFEKDIRQPLESYLIKNKLESKINYIVTTKGVPLRITGEIGDGRDRASVDSELSLILGPYSDQIGTINFVPNPYFEVDFPFSREMFGIYLVTRLTGYSVDDVVTLIDRAGRAEQLGIFVLDVDPSKDTSIGTELANKWLRDAAVALENLGQVVLLDQSTTFVTGQSNVLGYASWGSNDANDIYNAIPNFTWMPGSIAETFVSTSARTFTAPAVYGQSLIADLIAEGVTGVKGYVYEPFLDSMARPQILFARYAGGYSLADSYYAASAKLGWQDVVVGDPKMAISNIISGPNDRDPVAPPTHANAKKDSGLGSVGLWGIIFILLLFSSKLYIFMGRRIP